MYSHNKTCKLKIGLQIEASPERNESVFHKMDDYGPPSRKLKILVKFKSNCVS